MLWPVLLPQEIPLSVPDANTICLLLDVLPHGPLGIFRPLLVFQMKHMYLHIKN